MEPRKRRRIGPATRKALARRYGLCGPGVMWVPCAYCGEMGEVEWLPRRRRPAWHSTVEEKVLPSTVYFEHHIEHVVPVVAGGSDDVENLTLACPPCNYLKGVSVDDCWVA